MWRSVYEFLALLIFIVGMDLAFVVLVAGRTP